MARSPGSELGDERWSRRRRFAFLVLCRDVNRKRLGSGVWVDESQRTGYENTTYEQNQEIETEQKDEKEIEKGQTSEGQIQPTSYTVGGRCCTDKVPTRYQVLVYVIIRE